MSPAAFHDSGPHPHVHVLELTAAEAAAVLSLAEHCHRVHESAEAPKFLDEVQVIAHELPEPVRRHLNTARLDEEAHAVVISGNLVDQDALGPTPGHWREAQTPQSEVYAFVLSLYAALLGDAIGWAAQQGGRIITDVLPSPGYEQSLVSSSSDHELAWHIEDAFSQYRADWVGLLSLRNFTGVPTTLSYVDVQRVPPELATVLAQPRFLILPDSSHEFAGQGPEPEPVRILDGARERPVLRIDRDFVQPRAGDPEAERAFRWIVAHLDRNLYDLTIGTGDLCFVDNRNAVHGRRPFKAGFDGRDRWLKRANVVQDVRRTRPARRSATTRVIG
jgi:hypothetical protein